MPNRDLDIPKSFDGDLVKQSFPASKPTFWGPNQKTKYPNVYEDASGWLEIDVMRIPPVVRIITGGNFVPTVSFHTVYLGFMETFTAGVHSWNPSDFTERADIVALYSANQSTLTVAGYSAAYVGSFSGIPRRWYMFLFNSIFGDILTQTNTLFYFGSDVDVDASGELPPFGHIFFETIAPLIGTGLILQP